MKSPQWSIFQQAMFDYVKIANWLVVYYDWGMTGDGLLLLYLHYLGKLLYLVGGFSPPLGKI